MTQCIFMSAIGFLSGSIMFSYLIPRIFFKVDVTAVSADGNPGSTNAIRAVGLPAGISCMALDVFKAFIPVFISVSILGMRDAILAPVIAAPIVGHAFSPFLKFKGGKAVSTVFGSLLGIIAISRFVLVVALLLAFFRFIVIIRPDSAGVITAFAILAVLAFFFEPFIWFKIMMWLLCAVIALKQLQNPDKGEPSVSAGPFCITIRDNRLMLMK